MVEEGDAATYEIIGTEMTLQDALVKVCKVSRTYCKLFIGTKKMVKRALAGEVKFIMLAKDSLEEIKSLTTTLAKSNNIPIVSIESRAELARIVGIESTNPSRKEKSKGCCAAAIQDYCEQTLEACFVQEALIKGISS